MDTQDVRVTVRVDRELKESADSLFERLGLNMSVAFNLFLRKAVIEDAIPFPVSAKSSTFTQGLSVNDISNAFTAAVHKSITTNQQRGLPVARYDIIKKQAYLEAVDGSREYING